MDAKKYLHLLQSEFHSVVFATIDEKNHPVTCVIDIMLADENSLYFLTAKGKPFYARLRQNPFVSITGKKGSDTLSSQSITVHGLVREIGTEFLSEIFAANSYMEKIYPQEESRTALRLFQIYQGEGEFFDLSVKPIFRERFSFGNATALSHGYFINDTCIGCKMCYSVCPQKCIDISGTPVIVQQEHCLQCGNCADVCPVQAIEKR